MPWPTTVEHPYVRVRPPITPRIDHIANHPTDASCIFEAARAHLKLRKALLGLAEVHSSYPLELGPGCSGSEPRSTFISVSFPPHSSGNRRDLPAPIEVEAHPKNLRSEHR